jgi:hypothetical protein
MRGLVPRIPTKDVLCPLKRDSRDKSPATTAPEALVA